MSNKVLCVTGIGVKTIRKDFKKRSEVKIKNWKDYTLHTIRFDNVELNYDNQYLNWENYNCCGGWAKDFEYLNHAVQNNRKLYAGILKRDLEELIPELESLGLCYGYEENPNCAFICKKGCVADYIDLDIVLDNYKRLGCELDQNGIDYLRKLTKHPMSDFSSKKNPYQFDYANPESVVECIFNGLLLGYTLESTAWFIGL